MIRIEFKSSYYVMYQKLVKDDPDLRVTVAECIKWFKNNPEDTRLDNHKLVGPMTGKWAFSITDDIRVIYVWRSKTAIRLLAIGGHRDVYGKE